MGQYVMGQYDWLFHEFKKEEVVREGMLPQVQAYFRGELDIDGAEIHLPYRAFTSPCVLSKTPHFHRDEEYLAFVGHDLRNAFESFDAEIELWIGETLDDMEKIVITEPSMVRVPQFFWHGPIEIKRLGKPLFFQPVLFNSRYHAIRRIEDEQGKEHFIADCEGITPCSLNREKKCTFCGKCGK